MFIALFVKKSYSRLHDLEIDSLTSKMTLNHQNNIIPGFYGKKPNENEVLHIFLALFNFFFMVDLEIYLLTLRMTLKHENNIRKAFFNENYTKMRYYTCFYLFWLKNHFWPWNWPLILNFTSLAQLFEGCQDVILLSLNIYTVSINNK